MATKGNITPQEAATIKSQLKLRLNELVNSWEVYTTIHGTGVFRWFKIDAATMRWYVKYFDPPIAQTEFAIDKDTGGIEEPSDFR